MGRMRGTAVLGVAGLALATGLVGCSSSGTSSPTASSTASSPASSPASGGTAPASASTASGAASASGGARWQTPQDALAGIKAAGFDCTLPSSATTGQILTTAPFTGTALAGNALVRCPDFQVMLASGSVNDGFAILVKCQTVPASIRQAPEWTVPVIVGDTFIVLPSNLSAGWSASVQPADVITAFGGTQSTFGEVYDASCAGRESGASPAASSASSPAASPAAS